METSIENESNITERGHNLLPCPFCGELPSKYRVYHRPGCYLHHLGLSGITLIGDYDEEWNRRAKPGGENPIPQQPQAKICFCEEHGEVMGGTLILVRNNCPHHGGRKLSALRQTL